MQLDYGTTQTDAKTNRESDGVSPCPRTALCMQSAAAALFISLAHWWNVCVTERYADRVQITEG